MAIATTLYHDSVSQYAGYAVYAEARLGGNGDINGMPEFVTGGSNGEPTYERVTWDNNLEDGFDTDDVATNLSADFDAVGGETTVAGDTAGTGIYFSQEVVGLIDRVELRALTLAAASATWCEVSIQFFKNGVAVDSYLSGSGPTVNTIGLTSNYVAESILVVTPSAADYDRVLIKGSVRMTFDSPTVIPGGADLGLQAFVFTH